MARAKAKLYYTKQKYLDTLPVTNGNIIFVPDSKTFCLDISNQRFKYQTVEIFETDNDRLGLEQPFEGFYFVEETGVAWRWKDNQWKRISPVNLEPVIYGASKEDFPVLGKENTLYYTDDGIFNWKSQSNEYNLIANANRWNSIQ